MATTLTRSLDRGVSLVCVYGANGTFVLLDIADLAALTCGHLARLLLECYHLVPFAPNMRKRTTEPLRAIDPTESRDAHAGTTRSRQEERVALCHYYSNERQVLLSESVAARLLPLLLPSQMLSLHSPVPITSVHLVYLDCVVAIANTGSSSVAVTSGIGVTDGGATDHNDPKTNISTSSADTWKRKLFASHYMPSTDGRRRATTRIAANASDSNCGAAAAYGASTQAWTGSPPPLPPPLPAPSPAAPAVLSRTTTTAEPRCATQLRFHILDPADISRDVKRRKLQSALGIV